MRMSLSKLLERLLNIPSLHCCTQILFRNIKQNKQLLAALLAREQCSRLLDFGCGSGLFCEIISADRYIGYDIDSKRIEHARSKHPDYSFTTELPQDLSNIDIILFNSVLHHIKDEDLKKIFQIIHSKANSLKIIIVEFYPIEQQDFITKILLYIERYIHFSRQNSMEAWIKILETEDFSVIEKGRLKFEFLLIAELNQQRMQNK